MAITIVVAQPTARQVTSHHQSTINGKIIRYAATVQETWLTDAMGKPGVSMITTAYTLDNVSQTAERPIVFVFNGGPGASSMPLHMTKTNTARHKDRFDNTGR